MSTYLVAFVVSDFKSIETNTSSGIKVCGSHHNLSLKENYEKHVRY